MRRRLLCLVMVLSLLPAMVQAAFTDIATSPYRSAIESLEKAGVVGGYPDGAFRPMQIMNRAELLKVALATDKSLEPPKRRCFPDVPLRVWFAPYVCEGKERRIVGGYPDGSFKPENPVNMAEGLRILLRAGRVSVNDPVDEAWYEPYVAFAHGKGIISRHTYNPSDPMTRGRMAQVLDGIRRWKEDGDTPGPGGFLSSGCGKSSPQSPPSSVDVNGTLRSFILAVPDGYSPREPRKLIVAFHGRTNSNQQVRQYYKLERYGPEYMVVYPSALKSGSSYYWSAKEDGDYAFFDRLTQSLMEQYCIDTDHIYIVGHSLGAWFGNSIACARGNVIRGSFTLGGDTTSAQCTGSVASMVLHNPNDQQASFTGGMQARDLHLSQNSCNGTDTVATGPRDLLCVRYAGCPTESPVIWCPHEKNITSYDNTYYPHQWPDGAGEAAIDFFREQR